MVPPLNEAIKTVEDCVIKLTVSEGYLPTRKTIMSHTKFGYHRIKTIFKFSRCLHELNNGSTYNIRVSGRVLEEILDQYNNMPEKFAYFDKWIQTLKKDIEYVK